jgi:hypothetical protein
MRRKRKRPAGLGQGAGKLVHHSAAVNDHRLPQIDSSGKRLGTCEFESLQARDAYLAAPEWAARRPKDHLS